MKNLGKMSSDELNIQSLIGNYLQFQFSKSGLTTQAHHLDEDSLSAFIEGNIGQNETIPIVNHLVDCSFCRNVTAELVRLDYAFAVESPLTADSESSSKISQVLSGILGRIFGTNEEIVFAHQEPEDSEETDVDQPGKTKESD